MKTNLRQKNRSGMTLTEVIFVILGLAIAWMVLLPALGTRCGRRYTKSTRCVNNQKQILSGLTMFAQDHGDRFPPQVPTNEGGSLELIQIRSAYPHFLGLSNYLANTAMVLVCPASGKTATNNFAALNDSHLSYFMNLDADVRRTNQIQILIGDDFISSDSPIQEQKMILTKNTILHWTGSHSEHASIHSGNLAFTDGHVSQLRDTNLQTSWLRSGQEQARFALPRK